MTPENENERLKAKIAALVQDLELIVRQAEKGLLPVTSLRYYENIKNIALNSLDAARLP